MGDKCSGHGMSGLDLSPIELLAKECDFEAEATGFCIKYQSRLHKTLAKLFLRITKSTHITREMLLGLEHLGWDPNLSVLLLTTHDVIF